MYSRETMRLVWNHLLAVYGPLAFRATQLGFVAPSRNILERRVGTEEGTSDKPTFVMISDPQTGRIWYESSKDRRREIQPEPIEQ